MENGKSICFTLSCQQERINDSAVEGELRFITRTLVL